jgi:Uma2 family endonuclease
MLALKRNPFISEQEYLGGEKISEIKHEYIDGDVYAMAGTSENHNLISTNLIAELVPHLKTSNCKPFMADIKLQTDDCFFYPDLMVVCDDEDTDVYCKKNPVLIVEVLSKSTKKFDQTFKREIYQKIASLKEYILIEQDVVDIEVCRKNASSSWVSSRYFMGDEIFLESIDLKVSVEDIYYRVKNDDVLLFLENKKQAEQQAEEKTNA